MLAWGMRLIVLGVLAGCGVGEGGDEGRATTPPTAPAGTSVWTQIMPSSAPAAGRASTPVVFDPDNMRMIFSHGSNGRFTTFDDTWALDLSAGVEVFVDHTATTGLGPVPAWGGSLVFDSTRSRILMFGGEDTSDFPHIRLNEIWALAVPSGEPVGSWTLLAPTDTGPTGRVGHTAIYDAASDRLVVFGGEQTSDGTDTTIGDVWALQFSGLDADGVWTPLSPTGTPPVPREFHTAIVHPSTARMIVFGGQPGTVFGPAPRLNDVWVLSLTPGAEAWTPLSLPGAPSARQEHSAIFDVPNNRMIVFGGTADSVGSGPVPLNDVWSLSLAAGSEAWMPLTPAGTAPAARSGHLAVFDASNARMIVYAGFTFWPSTPFTDTWELTLP